MLSDVKFGRGRVSKVPSQSVGAIRLEWAGHTRSWTLGTGVKVWLRTSARASHFPPPPPPPEGIYLPIVLGDETVISQYGGELLADTNCP